MTAPREFTFVVDELGYIKFKQPMENVANGEVVHVIEYAALEAALNHCATTGAAVAKERDRALAMLEKMAGALERACGNWEEYVTELAQEDLENINHAEAEALKTCKRQLAEYRREFGSK